MAKGRERPQSGGRERVEPGVELPSVSVSREDAPTYRRGRSARRGGRASPPGLFLHLVVVLLIAGVCALGWFTFTQAEALGAAREELASAGERIRVLEGAIEATGRTLEQTEDETGDQLAFWEDEIRKLWDVSNKRNRQWIKDNERAIAQLGERMDRLGGRIATVAATAEEHAQILGSESSLVDRMGELEAAVQQMASTQDGDRDLLRGLVDDVNSMKFRLDRDLQETEASVQRMEEWIEAINAWRQETNRQLQALRAPPA